MTVADATLHLLAVREAALVTALLGRGHGAVAPIRPAEANADGEDGMVETLMPLLKQARRNPRWSSLGADSPVASSSRRSALVERIASALSDALGDPDGAVPPPPVDAAAA